MRSVRSHLSFIFAAALLMACSSTGDAAAGSASSRDTRPIAFVDNSQGSPAKTFRDCPDGCPEMIVVPGGTFRMGSSDEERADLTRRFGDFFASEGPQQMVTVSPFAVGVYEVTWHEWEACVQAGACDGSAVEATGGDNGWGKGRRPVVEISWHQAQSYLSWLSQKTGHQYRLLTEAEWEYAARAQSQGNFAWGDEIGIETANCDGCGSAWDNQKTAPVGSFGPNAFGLHDMHGNVMEWVEDCWSENHENLPLDGKARVMPDCVLRVVRGGAWNLGPIYLRSAARDCYQPGDQLNTVGFRVARTLKAREY